jgi:Transposase and inactivated derivatives
VWCQQAERDAGQRGGLTSAEKDRIKELEREVRELRQANEILHAVTDAKGRPIRFFMSAGQVSDYTGVAALLGSLPKADWLLADQGYDADWLREAFEDERIKACIPGRSSRKKTVKYDKRRYMRRNCIEIMFGRLKDWRRVATRYDRCPETFFSAVALAATVLVWL